MERLSWNSKTYDFPEQITMLFWTTSRAGSQEVAFSGDRETLTYRTDVNVRGNWNSLCTYNPVAPDLVSKTALRNFMQWAQAGGAFTFAKNSGKTCNTTLASGVAPGATSCSVTSAAGIQVGDEYVIRDRDNVEVVLVTAVSGTTITFALNPLNFAYASGSRFRYVEFWPAVADPSMSMIEPAGNGHFSVRLAFTEDVSAL